LIAASSSSSYLSTLASNPVFSFFLSLNPLILVILGVIVFFAGKLAKFVGIVIVILGVLDFLFPYLTKLA
jgi:hypothetical protein